MQEAPKSVNHHCRRFFFPFQTQENPHQKPFLKDSELENMDEVRGSAGTGGDGSRKGRPAAETKSQGQRSLWLLCLYFGFDGFGLQRFSLAGLIASSHTFYEVYYCYKENTVALRIMGLEKRRLPVTSLITAHAECYDNLLSATRCQAGHLHLAVAGFLEQVQAPLDLLLPKVCRPPLGFGIMTNQLGVSIQC